MTPPDKLTAAICDLERACGAYLERRVPLSDLATAMHVANGLMARTVQNQPREERV